MRVILKEDVENLGRKGDIVDIAPGYGRNYLIPKKIALEVTPFNMKMIAIEKEALMKRAEKERLSYQGLIEKLNQTSLSFQRKTGEKDVIFGSVSASDIKDALRELDIEIDKKKILLEEPLKRLGNYTVPIKIYHEERAEVKVEIARKEESEPKEEKEEGEIPEEKKEEAEVKKAIKKEKKPVKKEGRKEKDKEKEEGGKKAVEE